jgi:hypothetical protein
MPPIRKHQGASIDRQTESLTLALTTSAGTTPAVNFAQFAGGRIYIPTGSSITTLTFHDAPTPDGTYLPAQDADGEAITLTVEAGKSYPLPDELFAAAQLKIVADAAGSVALALKS